MQLETYSFKQESNSLQQEITNTALKMPLYTVHHINHDVLEQSLVKYTDILRDLMANVWQNIAKNTPHYSLLSGPSGTGKSHVLTLFYNRLMANETLCSHAKIVWFAEHEWTICDYNDLLLRLLEQVNSPAQINDFEQQLEALYLLPASKIRTAAEHLLSLTLSEKPLLVLCENFDVLLDGFGAPDQRKLIAFLQKNQQISLVTTAINKIESGPFKDFFAVESLEPLSLDEATSLLISIATLNQKPHLADIFNSPAGKVSINAIHHLAGGISRVYVAFSQMVQHDPLTEFSDVMLRILDQLGPAYQARLKHLSPQQRKLIASLANKPGTTPVVEIAKYNRMSQQTASGQLKKLRDSADVKSTAVGRSSHYEIATPLMRLALVLEQPKSKPVHALLNFLSHWFASREQGLLTQDGECFVYDKHWLYEANRPTSLPLNIRIQHHITSYVEALATDRPCQFMMLREKITEVGQLLHAKQDEVMNLDHINLLYGLACHNLIKDNHNHALIWCEDLYDFAQIISSATLWKHTAQLTINLTAMFAVAGRVVDTGQMLNQLEKLETGLHNLPFSIALSHCLIAKAKGYALIEDKAKTQQTLEQLRMRADKRNNPQIAGAYGHAVKATLTYVAAQDKKLALKLFKHVEDISNKYHHTELLFSCARALWTSLPEVLTFARIVELTVQVNTLNTFNREICLLLRELAQRPEHEQAVNHDLLWQKMVVLGCEPVFAAGWVQVGLYLATETPPRFHSWLNGCLPLLNGETSLHHSRNVLFAVQAYLNHEQDPHQLLVLPQEERVLVLAALAAKKT